MSQHALILFDIDGTLLQTELVTVPAVQRTLAAHGLPIPDKATICCFFGKPVEEYEAWLAKQCPADTAVAIVEAINECELGLIGKEGTLFPGVREVLVRLSSDGHVLAVFSNGPEPYVNEFLDVHAVRGFFREIRTRGPRFLTKISMVADILAHVPVRPVFVVGDRADDIEAAHANGALAIAATYGFGSVAEWSGADGTISEAAELPKVLRSFLRETS